MPWPKGKKRPRKPQTAGRPPTGRPRVAPPVIPKGFETEEHDVGQDGVVEDRYNRNGEPEVIIPQAEPIENPAMKEKLEYEIFMQDMVTILIHPSPERGPVDNVFDVAVNGKSHLFERGKEYTVPRYVVETLARAKTTQYENQEYVGSDGVKGVRWPSRTGVRYPFSVRHDPHPRGFDWLQHVLQQP